jgi:hypothetical protein
VWVLGLERFEVRGLTSAVTRGSERSGLSSATQAKPEESPPPEPARPLPDWPEVHKELGRRNSAHLRPRHHLRQLSVANSRKRGRKTGSGMHIGTLFVRTLAPAVRKCTYASLTPQPPLRRVPAAARGARDRGKTPEKRRIPSLASRVMALQPYSNKYVIVCEHIYKLNLCMLNAQS